MSNESSTVLPASAAPTLRLLGVLTRFKVGVELEARVVEGILDKPPIGLLETLKMVESPRLGWVRLTESGALTARRLIRSPDAEARAPEDMQLFALQAAGMNCFSFSHSDESEHCQVCPLAFACGEMSATYAASLAKQLVAADNAKERSIAAEVKATKERERQETQARARAEEREKANINDVMRRLKATAPPE